MKTTETMKTIVTRCFAIVMAFVMCLTNVTVVRAAEEIKAEEKYEESMLTKNASISADTEVEIVSAGYGTIKKTLTTGEDAKVIVDDCEMTITVGTDKYTYLSDRYADPDVRKVVAKAVVADDDLLHILHLSGKYVVIDLRYSAFTIVEAWRSYSTRKYVNETTDGTSYEVKGYTIMSKTQFKEVVPGTVTDRTVESLMTREEFEALVNPQPTTQAPVTEAPTTQVPVTEAPTTQAPVTEAPTTQVPTTQASITEAPTTQAPTTVSQTEIKGEIDVDWVNQTKIDATVDWQKQDNIEWQKQDNIEWQKQDNIEWQKQDNIEWQKLDNIEEQKQDTAQWKADWDEQTQSSNTSTTYYYYDEQGRLVKEVTEGKDLAATVGTTTGKATVQEQAQATVKEQGQATVQEQGQAVVNEQGQATVKEQGQATVQEQGQATVKITEESKGQATARIEVVAVTTQPAQTASSSSATAKATTKAKAKKVKKAKAYYHVKRKGKKVTLQCRKGGKTGAVCTVWHDKKTKIAKYDGITYKNVKYVGYAQGSRQIGLLTYDDYIYIIPRAKGLIGKTYTKKKLKGKWSLIIEDNAGLMIRASNQKNKVMGLKNVQPKELKK